MSLINHGKKCGITFYFLKVQFNTKDIEHRKMPIL